MEVLTRSDLEGVDWQELAEVYRRAPLGTRDPAQLERAFASSAFTTIAYQGGVVVGAARAISDGEYYANVYDVVVLPEHQGKGVGRQLMRDLLDRIGAKFVLLTTTIGKEPFYATLGFRRHKTAMAIYPPGREEHARLYLED